MFALFVHAPYKRNVMGSCAPRWCGEWDLLLCAPEATLPDSESFFLHILRIISNQRKRLNMKRIIFLGPDTEKISGSDFPLCAQFNPTMKVEVLEWRMREKQSLMESGSLTTLVLCEKMQTKSVLLKWLWQDLAPFVGWIWLLKWWDQLIKHNMYILQCTYDNVLLKRRNF